jgi:hypothetical protein
VKRSHRFPRGLTTTAKPKTAQPKPAIRRLHPELCRKLLRELIPDLLIDLISGASVRDGYLAGSLENLFFGNSA